MISKLAKRVLTAAFALTGKFEGSLEELGEARRVEAALRSTLERLSQERQYWYDLWFYHSREYHNAQMNLIDEINKLRRQAGIEGADRLKELETKAEQQRYDRLVEPPKHPVKGVESDLETVEQLEPSPILPRKPVELRTKSAEQATKAPAKKRTRTKAKPAPRKRTPPSKPRKRKASK